MPIAPKGSLSSPTWFRPACTHRAPAWPRAPPCPAHIRPGTAPCRSRHHDRRRSVGFNGAQHDRAVPLTRAQLMRCYRPSRLMVRHIAGPTSAKAKPDYGARRRFVQGGRRRRPRVRHPAPVSKTKFCRNFAGIWHGLSLASRGRISELKSTSAHRVRAVRNGTTPEMLRNC